LINPILLKPAFSGETPLPRTSSSITAPTKTASVFDLISEKDRKRLEELTGRKLDTSQLTTTTHQTTFEQKKNEK
jgi:hypothetical protein